MEIYFIRHAESTNNALWTGKRDMSERVPDPELTRKGNRQRELLAKRLKRPFKPAPGKADYHNRRGFGLTHIYCSLLTRSILTALPTARALDLPLLAHNELHEFGGVFDYDEYQRRRPLPGPGRQYFVDRFPTLQLPADLPEEGWWRSRSETEDDMLARADRLVGDLLDRHGDDDRVAIVSHGGFYQTFMAILLSLQSKDEGVQRPPYLSFGINNTGITRVRLTNGRTAIFYANSVAHLPAELHTV